MFKFRVQNKKRAVPNRRTPILYLTFFNNYTAEFADFKKSRLFLYHKNGVHHCTPFYLKPIKTNLKPNLCMKKLTTIIFVLTMQRYHKKPTRENLFNESALSFSEMNYFTFVYLSVPL